MMTSPAGDTENGKQAPRPFWIKIVNSRTDVIISSGCQGSPPMLCH
jgi:hypothetical protein